MAVTKYIVTLVLLTYLAQAEGQTVFNTTNGPVRGETINVNDKSLDVLLSIPFAKPPVGNLRFKPPQPADAWTGVLEATKPSPACIQASIFYTAPPDDPLYFAGNYSEDCLYLNIWKPSYATRDSNLPVMLWVYGGGFNLGMKDVELYDGKFLSAEYEVIFVSLSYRVGLLGFGYLGQDTLPGNLGLLDQLEAMKWVKNNIVNFGGDPAKVTLFGESAGSWSVGLHLVSPLSTHYFKNAIMQSGAPVIKVLEGVVYSHEKSKENVRQVTNALKCSGNTDWDMYSCLMGASTDELISAVNAVAIRGVDFYPVVDNHFLPDPPLTLLKRGLHKGTNVMMGVNKDEYSFFLQTAINPLNFTLLSTNEIITYDDIDNLIGKLILSGGFNDKNKIKALKLFYGSQLPTAPGEQVVKMLSNIMSDLTFACPTHLFGSVVSNDPLNDVYVYILNYRLSNVQLPAWTGVPHGYEIELMFGLPLDPQRSYTDEDRQISRVMMTYWTNFAKSGTPNSPLSVSTNWPLFDSQNQSYVALDSGSNLATRQGPRRHECAFVNEILPKVPSKGGDTTPQPCLWPESSGGLRVRLDVSAVAAVVLLLLPLF